MAGEPRCGSARQPLGGYGAGYRPNAPFSPGPAYGPGYQTQLSPFLNLLRGGDASANYFLGVVPEQQRRRMREPSERPSEACSNSSVWT